MYYVLNVLNLGEGCLQENWECMEISLENLYVDIGA